MNAYSVAALELKAAAEKKEMRKSPPATLLGSFRRQRAGRAQRSRSWPHYLWCRAPLEVSHHRPATNGKAEISSSQRRGNAAKGRESQAVCPLTMWKRGSSAKIAATSPSSVATMPEDEYRHLSASAAARSPAQCSFISVRCAVVLLPASFCCRNQDQSVKSQ